MNAQVSDVGRRAIASKEILNEAQDPEQFDQSAQTSVASRHSYDPALAEIGILMNPTWLIILWVVWLLWSSGRKK